MVAIEPIFVEFVDPWSHTVGAFVRGVCVEPLVASNCACHEFAGLVVAGTGLRQPRTDGNHVGRSLGLRAFVLLEAFSVNSITSPGFAS